MPIAIHNGRTTGSRTPYCRRSPGFSWVRLGPVAGYQCEALIRLLPSRGHRVGSSGRDDGVCSKPTSPLPLPHPVPGIARYQSRFRVTGKRVASRNRGLGPGGFPPRGGLSINTLDGPDFSCKSAPDIARFSLENTGSRKPGEVKLDKMG